MPSIGEVAGTIIRFIGDQMAASSLRLGPIPAVTVFLVVLVLLSLIARPSTRWTVRDLGRLASVPRAMALAAEAGSAAAFSLGTAGVGRATSAFDRIQTLAALPILGHVARAAARSGVPLLVTANDPVTVHLAEGTLADAHRRTDTQEREERSRVSYVGEGRATAAAAELASPSGAATVLVIGGLGEEALLMLAAASRDAEWTSHGTAAPSQAGSLLLTGAGTLIGPEAFQAPADIGPAAHARTGALAANRLIIGILAVLVVGSMAAVLAGFDPAATLAGR
jgi:hypothetical protein